MGARSDVVDTAFVFELIFAVDESGEEKPTGAGSKPRRLLRAVRVIEVRDRRRRRAVRQSAVLRLVNEDAPRPRTGRGCVSPPKVQEFPVHNHFQR
jgi:hypothetical protein